MGFVWLRIGTGGIVVNTTVRFLFHKMMGIWAGIAQSV
jgi:hypothetical protein